MAAAEFCARYCEGAVVAVLNELPGTAIRCVRLGWQRPDAVKCLLQVRDGCLRRPSAAYAAETPRVCSGP